MPKLDSITAAGSYAADHIARLALLSRDLVSIGALYSSVAEAAASSIPSPVQAFRTAGYTSSGDGGGALYKRVSSSPSHSMKITSADGAFWEYVPEDGVNVLSAGAKGDGATADNTPILAAHVVAALTGTYVRFPARTYGISSQVTIVTSNIKWVGDPHGGTVIKRVGATSGGAVIAIGGSTCTDVYFENIKFNFDKASYVGSSNWGILLNSNVVKLRVKQCEFASAVGAIGYGIYIQGNGSSVDGTFADASYVIEDCRFYDNAKSGIWAENTDRLTISRCYGWDNSEYMIRIDTQDGVSYVKTNRRISISKCYAWRNAGGIGVGNVNSTNSNPSVLWGTGFADVRNIFLDSCYVWDNTGYGFAVSNDYVQMTGCYAENNAAANVVWTCRDSTIEGGQFIDTTQNNPWNLDIATSTRCTYSNLTVVGSGSGLSGLGIYSRATGCRFIDQTGVGISMTPVESDGAAVAFQDLGVGMTIQGCQFFMNNSTVRGVQALDGYQGLVVEDCDFWPVGTAIDSDVYNAVRVLSDLYVVRNNRWNGRRSRTTNPSSAGGVYLLPLVCDEHNITVAGYTVEPMTDIRFWGAGSDMHQKVTWVRVAHKGVGGATPFTGTLPTTITFTGGGGSGASAQPFFDQDGWLIGARMNGNYGSGYTSTPTAVIGGTGGTGCTLTPNVGFSLAPSHRFSIWSLSPIDLISGTPAFSLPGNRTRLRVPGGGRVNLTCNFSQYYADEREDLFLGSSFPALTTSGNQMSAATVSAGGTGYTLGDTLTLTGTGSAQVRVTGVSSGVVTAVALIAAGNIASPPANPVATTGGTGSGCTITATWVAVSHVCSDTTSEVAASPSGTISAATITMPAYPYDGMKIEVNSTQIITTLTVQGNTGQSVTGAPTTLAANGSFAMRYRASNTTWRRCA